MVTQSDSGDVIQRDGRESAKQLAACGRVVPTKIWQLKELGYAAVDDETTQQTMRELKELGYTSGPHAAVAYRALRDQLNPGEYGLFLGTAHPAKFKESVEAILGQTWICQRAGRTC